MLNKTDAAPTWVVTMLTPDQLRAARALIDWSRDDLAKKSGVSANTVKGFERGGSDPKLSTLHKWRRALEAAGVQFLDEGPDAGPGVRLIKIVARAKR
jgi:transcriptional regulator with XRE-family HTH domain